MQENDKPKVRLVGEDGNIFNLIAIASKALRYYGQREKVSEMTQRVYESQSYQEALSIILEYVQEAGDDLAYDEGDDEFDNEFDEFYDDDEDFMDIYDDDDDDYEDEDDDDEIFD